MGKHIWVRALGALAVAGGLVVCSGSVAASAAISTASSPPQTGCPEGFKVLSVAYLEAQGPYFVPALVDGQGNNDGFVCGNADPPALEGVECRRFGGTACELIALGLPTYHFIDDVNPGQPHNVST